MSKNIIILVLSILLSWLFVSTKNKEIPRNVAIDVAPRVEVSQSRAFQRTNPEPPTPATSSSTSAPSVAYLEYLRNEHLKDVKRSAQEDSRMLGGVLSLSTNQQDVIFSKLEQLRLATEASEITEYDIVTSVLTPEQISNYETYLEQKRRTDAEQFASIRLNSIERITGPLTDPQKDAIFNAIASGLMKREVTSDTDILKSSLTIAQYSLWSQSTEAEPIQVRE